MSIQRALAIKLAANSRQERIRKIASYAMAVAEGRTRKSAGPTVRARKAYKPAPVKVPTHITHRTRHLGQLVKEDPSRNPASSQSANPAAGAAAAAVSRTPEFLDQLNAGSIRGGDLRRTMQPLIHTLEQTPAGQAFGKTRIFSGDLTSTPRGLPRGTLAYGDDSWLHKEPFNSSLDRPKAPADLARRFGAIATKVAPGAK